MSDDVFLHRGRGGGGEGIDGDAGEEGAEFGEAAVFGKVPSKLVWAKSSSIICPLRVRFLKKPMRRSANRFQSFALPVPKKI